MVSRDTGVKRSTLTAGAKVQVIQLIK